jgi:hypothetical protein
MNTRNIENKVRRLSRDQLRALLVFSNAPNGVVDSGVMSKKLGINGKPLGGLFSSLSRQRLNGQNLIIPLGRQESGRGLRWRLNKEVVETDQLRNLIEEIFKFW